MEQQDCETRECETAALVRGCNLPVHSPYRNPLPAVSLRRRVAVHPPQTSQTLLHAHFTSPFSRPRCICRAPSCRRRHRRHVAPMAPCPSESTRPQHRAPAGIEQDASCATTLPRPRHPPGHQSTTPPEHCLGLPTSSRHLSSYDIASTLDRISLGRRRCTPSRRTPSYPLPGAPTAPHRRSHLPICTTTPNRPPGFPHLPR
jgi:hypothetical protein